MGLASMRLGAVVMSMALGVGIAIGSASAGSTSIWFGPNPVGAPDGLDTRFVEFAASATKTLDGCFYEIRLESLVDAFIAAHKRGVAVRLMVDDSNFYGKDENGKPLKDVPNPFVERLTKAGIVVKNDNDRSGLMHNKFAIADGARVWTGTYNLTDTCSYNNANCALRVDDAGLAAIYTRQFEEMYVSGLFGPSRPSTIAQQTVTVDGRPIEVLFAPEDNPLARQLELVKAAKKSVWFLQFAFTSDELADAMVAKVKKQKLDVRGIIDHRLYRSTGPYSVFSQLTAAGVPVVIYDKPDGKFHYKAFMIDAGTPEAVLICGSENASSNGNNVNDENIVVIRDPEILAKFASTFDRLYGETSHTAAELVYGEAPMAGSSIGHAELYVFSNGRPVKDVVVEFPPRWPIPEEVFSSATCFVGKKAVDPAQVAITAKKAVLNDINLEPSGPRSLLTIRLTDLPVPEIAGSYSPIVTVTHPGAGPTPLMFQPTITVFPADSAQPTIVMFEHLRVLFNRLAKLGELNGPGALQLHKAWEKDFQRFRQTVLSAAHNGRWGVIEKLLDLIESLEAEEIGIFNKLTKNVRELRRVLSLKAKTSPRAKALLARLDKLAAKVPTPSPAVTPPPSVSPSAVAPR